VRLSALKPAAVSLSSSSSSPAVTRIARSSFSTMSALQSAAAPSPSSGVGYDKEITDIASYVHNKPIDSELAVSGDPLFFFLYLAALAAPSRHDEANHHLLNANSHRPAILCT
jgi:hypothetical protein